MLLQLIYFGMLGHESCNLIKYLEGFQGVAPIKTGHNPATWMLEVTGGSTSTGVKASQLDFPAVYKVTIHYLFGHAYLSEKRTLSTATCCSLAVVSMSLLG